MIKNPTPTLPIGEGVRKHIIKSSTCEGYRRGFYSFNAQTLERVDYNLIIKIKPFFIGIFFLLNILDPYHLFSADSLETKYKPIEVESETDIIYNRLKMSSVSIIDKKEIENLNANRVSELLEFVPGVYIKDYGGEGGLKTISLRGTGAPQTSVMINGVPLNFAQNGTIDLSTLPAKIFSSVSVYRGGSMADPGANSQAGAVNFTIDGQSDNKCNAELKYGSFNYTGFNFSLPISIADTKIFTGIEYDRSDGDYSFNFNEFGTISEKSRVNSDHYSLHLYSIIPFNNSNESFSIFYKNIDRGTPGAIVQNNVQSSDARLKEEEILSIINNNFSLIGQKINFAGMVRVNRQNYSSSEITKYLPKGSIEYFAKDIYGDFHTIFSVFGELLPCDSYLSYSTLNSDQLQQGLSGFVDRLSGGINIKWNSQILTTHGLDLSLDAAAGTNYNSRSGWIFSPLAGFDLFINKLNTLAKFYYSYNFREPSFNELYYLNYGNQNLKPEKSHTFNTSIDVYPLDWMSINLSSYYSMYNDLISTVPKSPISFSAQNIDRSLNYGIETSMDFFPVDFIKLGFNYTRQFAIDNSENSINYKKSIPYVPEEIISGSVFFTPGNFLFGFDAIHCGYRYSSANNSLYSFLPEYTTANAFSSYKIKIQDLVFKFRIDLKNIFNSEYSLILNYPLPGRSYYFSLSLEI